MLTVWVPMRLLLPLFRSSLGKQITEVLDKLEAATTDEAITMDPKAGLKIGVAHIPEIFLDNTDRNRTSPFAFTGNRFEFRAVGSSANCGAAMIVLNTAVAAQLNDFYAEVSKLIASGTQKEKAIFTVIRSLIKECKAIRFDGNGYSDEWKEEAARRGLDCETSVPLNFDAYLRPQNVKIFTDTKVMSEVELHSRCEVKWETIHQENSDRGPCTRRPGHESYRTGGFALSVDTA